MPASASLRFALAFGLTIGLLFFLIAHLPFCQLVEWRVFDQWMRATAGLRPLAPEVALVVVDEESLAAVSRDPALRASGWPWPRRLHADLITALTAAGASQIVFDILFPQPSADAEDDDLLRAAAGAAGNVRFAATAQAPSLFSPTFSAQPAPETDDVFRRDPATGRLIGWPGGYAAAFRPRAINAASAVGIGAALRKASIPAADLYEAAALRPHYERLRSQGAGGRLDMLRGKVVYVGATAAAAFDLKATPLGPHEPGLVLHAAGGSNAITGDFFAEAPWPAVGALIILSPVAVALGVFLSRRRALQFASGLLIVGSIFLLSFILFLFHVWLPPVMASGAAFTAFAGGMAVRYAREESRRREIQGLFGNFVSQTVVNRLIENPDLLQLGGHTQEATVFFSDLAGFTQLSEKLPAATLVNALNEYLTEMSDDVLDRGGYLDKYIGDAIMAVFGGIDPVPDHALQACLAALDNQRRLRTLAPRLEIQYGVKLSARIGINTGEMVVGVMGSLRKRSYTVIGDPVNLASRLEGANKPYGTAIMISESTRAQAGNAIEVRPIDFLAVSGKEQPVRVYELLGRAGELDPAAAALRDAFTEAFEHYTARRWSEAERALAECLRLAPDDALAQLYLERVATFRASPPASDWDGVWRLTKK